MSSDLIDTHCHLTLGSLSKAPDQAWQRARQGGVRHALVVGIDAETSKHVVDYVEGKEDLSASVGIHPNSVAEEQPGDWQVIRELCKVPGVVAIGETGVDLYRDYTDFASQKKSLERHAELALEVERPLILHIRDAYPETGQVLEPYIDSGLRAVVHCFTGGPKDLSPFVEWGFCISFSGVLTYKNAPEVREAARLVPAEQCLVETDAPWLAPTPHRGKQNEPAYVIHTAERLAEERGVTFDEIALQTTANASRLFGLSIGE